MIKNLFLTLCVLQACFLQAAVLSDTAYVQQNLCHNDSLLVYDTWFDADHTSGMVLIEKGATDGTDSIIMVNLAILTPSIGYYRDTFCNSQTVVLFGKLFSPAQPFGQAFLPNAAANGCDSLLLIQLSFGAPATSKLTDVLCPNDTVFVNGVAYHQGYFIGTELIENGAKGGCDSLIEIRLNVQQHKKIEIQATLFEDESRLINGERFDIGHPEGTIVLPNMAQNGCDSILDVRFSFEPRPVNFAYIPTAFQPNALEVMNQTLQPGLAPEVVQIQNVQIFDRWGSLVFFTENNKNSAWDGLINGKKAAMGSYLVTLVLELEDGRIVQQSELVTLLR